MKTVPELPEGFSLDAYLPIDVIPDKKLASLLLTRAMLINQMYAQQIEQNLTYWDIWKLGASVKRPLFHDNPNTALIASIKKLIDEPLAVQTFERKSKVMTKEEMEAEQLLTIEQLYQQNNDPAKPVEAVRDLQICDVIDIKDLLCKLADEQLENRQASFKTTILETAPQNNFFESYRKALPHQAFAIIDLHRPVKEIKLEFSKWVSIQKRGLKSGKKVLELRKILSSNRLLEIIDLGLLVGPAFQKFYTLEGLAGLLPKKNCTAEYMDSDRLDGKDLGRQINRILHRNTIQRLNETQFQD